MDAAATVFRVMWVIALVVYLVLWIRALARITRTPDQEYRTGNQIVWAAVVVLIPVAGLLAYHAVGAPKRGS